MTTLDWRRHTIGRAAKCRLCGRLALLRDDRGRPCHKVCAEQEIDTAAATYAKTGDR